MKFNWTSMSLRGCDFVRNLKEQNSGIIHKLLTQKHNEVWKVEEVPFSYLFVNVTV